MFDTICRSSIREKYGHLDDDVIRDIFDLVCHFPVHNLPSRGWTDQFNDHILSAGPLRGDHSDRSYT